MQIEVKSKLKKIVGEEGFLDDPGKIDRCSRDFSMIPPGRPICVVQPRNTLEIQRIVRLANEEKFPVVPVSSAVHFFGATIPKEGGIVVDLSRMNRIIEIDEPNRKAMIEPGVTWGQLQAVLAKDGYMAMSPLLPDASRSVVTDYLEREVPVAPVYEYSEPLQSMEVVWPNGDIFKVGSASAPGFPNSFSQGANPNGPGALDFWRFLQGAQGTMGIVTWANIKIEHRPKFNKVFFIPFETAEDAVVPIRRIQKLKLGYECLLLDGVDMANLFSQDPAGDFESLKETLPPWTLILILGSGYRRPMGKIEYEEKALRGVAKEMPGLNLLTSLPNLPGLEKRLADMLRNPWPKETVHWKNRFKGRCESLFFITTMNKISMFAAMVKKAACNCGFSLDDLGCYFQPIETARACHCEFHFYYDPNIMRDREKVKKLFKEAAVALIDGGAQFTRPYGILSDLVFERTASYTATLKMVKNILDPCNIMNPSNLCF